MTKYKKPNPNETVLYEALELAKEYISAEGTGKPRPDRKQVLKQIRAALAPTQHVYKDRVRRLEAFLNNIIDMKNTLDTRTYWAAWFARNISRKKLDDYFIFVYNIIKRLEKEADELRA